MNISAIYICMTNCTEPESSDARCLRNIMFLTPTIFCMHECDEGEAEKYPEEKPLLPFFAHLKDEFQRRKTKVNDISGKAKLVLLASGKMLPVFFKFLPLDIITFLLCTKHAFHIITQISSMIAMRLKYNNMSIIILLRYLQRKVYRGTRYG